MNSNKINYGKVSLTSPHFLLSWRNNLSSTEYHHIFLLSAESKDANLRKELLVHDLKFEEAIKAVDDEIKYYIFELNHRNPVSYLIYHCQTMANVYSNVQFLYVNEINNDNLLYYIKTKSKQMGIFYNSYISDYQKHYANIEVEMIRSYACHDKYFYDKNHFNNILINLYDLILNQIATKDNFQFSNSLNIIAFAKWLSGISVYNFCIIMNYLKKIKLIKPADVENYLKFYYLNRKLSDFCS